jgi:hypothetical protein
MDTAENIKAGVRALGFSALPPADFLVPRRFTRVMASRNPVSIPLDDVERGNGSALAEHVFRRFYELPGLRGFRSGDTRLDWFRAACPYANLDGRPVKTH